MLLLRLKLTILSLAFCFSVSAQTKEEKITHIKQQFAAINADRSYEKIVLPNEDFVDEQATDGGMEVTGYFKDGKLVKISEFVGVSNGNYITEYYLDADTLIFAFCRFQMFQYTDSAGFNRSRMGDVVFEGRYYFDRNKLIDKIIKGDKEYDDKAARLEAEVKKYTAMLYKDQKAGK